MRPFFKISVAVHRILPILDVSGAHPLAPLSLIKRSSNSHQTLIKRSSIAHPMAHQWLFYRSSIAHLGSSWLFFFWLFLSISLGRSSWLIYRSAIAHLRGHSLVGMQPLSSTDSLRLVALCPLTGPAGVAFGRRLRPARSRLDLLGLYPVGAVPVGHVDRASRRFTRKRSQPLVPVS
jgi:hypothetical protein